MNTINPTLAPDLRSWVASANVAGADFPIQNLPFGRFRSAGHSEGALRIGIAIGDQVLDLRATGLIDTDDMNALMSATRDVRQALRAAISAGLAAGSDKQLKWERYLAPVSDVEMVVPCAIGDYTDFYVGIHHATRVGSLFRPENPLLPNYKWVPIGYHGRGSSIGVTGQRVRRPYGQVKGAADTPVLSASQRLDYELELGFFMGPGNAQGERIRIADAEQHLFGVTLLNDWSARDVQAWEYQPLGPFLSKNFATSISPWIVTMEALAPFRCAPMERAPGDPEPLPYLDSRANRSMGSIDVQLEVWLQTSRMREADAAAVRLTHANAAKAAYWTPAQLVAHHTINGCNLQPGDLLGSGTLSGAALGDAGSLLELTLGGKNPVTLPNGERRSFLEDGDTLILRGYCERHGAVRIGLGECVGTIMPAEPFA